MKSLNNNVLVFDLDGTLVDHNNRVIGGNATLEHLKKLHDDGMTLAVCTGRLDHDILKIIEMYDLPIRYRISQNGALFATDSSVTAKLLNQEEAMQVYGFSKDIPVRMEVNTISNRYWNTERDPLFPKELYDSHFIRDDYTTLIQFQPVILFLYVGEMDELKKIEAYVQENCKQVRAIYTSPTSLEIVNKEVSKGIVLDEYLKDSRIFSIGDSPSDYEMIPYSDVFYNVGPLDPQGAVKMPSILEALQDIENLLKGA